MENQSPKYYRQKLADRLRLFFHETGEMIRFSNYTIKEAFKGKLEWEAWGRHCYDFGYRTLPLISITAFIMGLVLTIQTRPVLAKIGAESWLPGMVFVSVVREIGPVITALIFAGKVGSGIGAELSSMRVTEQIDAMEVSGTNPIKFLVSTRVLATTLMVPVLVLYADAIALIGSYLGVNLHGKVSVALFLWQAFDWMYFYDILPATIKTFFFGYAIGIISCYKGYFCNEGTQGVGRSANAAVVISSLVVFVIDLVAVQISDIII